MKKSIDPPSERSFGILFSLIFSGLGVYASNKNWQPFVIYAFFAIGLLLLVVAFSLPKILTPFNKAWFWFGQAMGKIVNPIVLGIIFFLLLTPVAIMGKLMGRDELRLQKRKVNSYWIEREPIGPSPESFNNQF